MKRFYLENLGCSKNTVDGEVAIASLIDRGYLWSKDPETADIIILNTCGFIEAAVQESLDRLFELAPHRTHGHAQKLVLMGCLAQRYKEELARELPEVDVFVGTGYLKEMPDVLESKGYMFFDQRDTLTLSGPKPPLHLPVSYLKISEGCDNHCTYCLIPSLRGPMRSRSVEDILKEAKQLLKEGAKEFILIAQDVSRYGTDRGQTLEELLKALNALEGDFWIRLQYVYPDVLQRSFFETMASCEKIVAYLDMPIQHISERVLRRMNRRTSKQDIIRVINWAREIVPNIALRTTVMVGFPGETEEEFEELLAFLEEYPFERLGAFSYSDEEGAYSTKLTPKVPTELKQERHERLMLAQMQRAEELSATLVGTIQQVLVEEQGAEGVIARTMWDAPDVDCVLFVADSCAPVGTFLRVRVTQSDGLDLIGVIDEPSK